MRAIGSSERTKSGVSGGRGGAPAQWFHWARSTRAPRFRNAGRRVDCALLALCKSAGDGACEIGDAHARGGRGATAGRSPRLREIGEEILQCFTGAEWLLRKICSFKANANQI